MMCMTPHFRGGPGEAAPATRTRLTWALRFDVAQWGRGAIDNTRLLCARKRFR